MHLNQFNGVILFTTDTGPENLAILPIMLEFIDYFVETIKIELKYY